MNKQLLIKAIVIYGVFVGHVCAMNVDDAQILNADTCQLESVLKFDHNGTERGLSPACGLTDNLEVSLGHAWRHDAAGMYMSANQLQAKTVFGDMSGATLGLLAGVERQVESLEEEGADGARQASWNYYSKLLTSFSFKNDAVLVNANLGFHHVRQEGSTRLTWGLGNETRWTDRLSVISEVYGENKGKPSYHAGILVALVPARVELDLAYGNTFGGQAQGQYVIFGLRLIAAELLR